MMAAFYCFLREPSCIQAWFLDPWPRHLIRPCVSCLWTGRARAVCSNILIDGCVFCHRPWEQDGPQQGDTARRDVPLPRTMDQSRQVFFTVCFSVSAKQNSCTSRSLLLRQ